MSQKEATAWWAEVEHLRERIEQRDNAAETQAAAPRPSAARPRRTILIAGRGAPAPAVGARPLVDVGRDRPSRPTVHRAAQRPDRVAMWAVLLGLALMLVATTSAGAATSLGERTLKAPMEGRDVRLLQRNLKDLGLLRAPATAHFGTLTRRAVRRYQRSRCLVVDGIAGPGTIAALRGRAPRCSVSDARRLAGRAPVSAPRSDLRSRVVTWYGPGMYGRRTACGDTLTSRLVGVAHRTLPCGTRVRFVNGGRTVVARVVDRGPHAAGVHYDLTWAAARQLDVLAAGRVAVRASR